MAIYICPQCGADIELEHGLTCEYCGFEVPGKKCSQCGRDIPDESIMCPLCGAPQKGDSTPSAPEGLETPAYGDVISNVPQSTELHGGAFEEKETHFGHHEEIEEIIDDHEEIDEAEFLEETVSGEPVEEEKIPAQAEKETLPSAVPGDDEPVPLSIGHDEEVQYMTYSETQKEERQAEIPEEPETPEEKICESCGFANPTIARFCLSCGSPLDEKPPLQEGPESVICPDCGFENSEDARFCMVCGAKLDREAASETASRPDVKESPAEVPVQNMSADQHVQKLFNVKVTYDKENKFQQKFVFNKIRESNHSIAENELNTLMTNNSFMIQVEEDRFQSLQAELEDLDCTVEMIGEEISGVEKSPSEEDEPIAAVKGPVSYSLLVKGMKGHEQSWRGKFVKMIMLMIPSMTEEMAWQIATSEEKRIPMENEETARDLQKILSRMGCITQIIEHKGHHPAEEDVQMKETAASAEETVVQKEKTPQPVSPEEKKTSARPVDDNIGKDDPRYLILSGVDKRNWVVREKLAESIVDIYPNMTPDIAAGIVSQPVVRLRVQNQDDAERLGKQFEEMGWNIRIEDVATFSDKSKKTGATVSRADVQRRKAARLSYLKREKGKRRNFITTIIITIIAVAALLIVYDAYFKPRYYVTVQAEANHPEVSFTASSGSFIYLRKEPSLSAMREDYRVSLDQTLRLFRKDVLVGEDGMQYYEVYVPGFRAHRAYLLAELAFRSDENGAPVAPE
jgi:predicted amidophosphoribosyltransferase